MPSQRQCSRVLLESLQLRVQLQQLWQTRPHTHIEACALWPLRLTRVCCVQPAAKPGSVNYGGTAICYSAVGSG
eukprot:4943384-Pleurochrysis_carterae.AAC.1